MPAPPPLQPQPYTIINLFRRCFNGINAIESRVQLGLLFSYKFSYFVRSNVGADHKQIIRILFVVRSNTSVRQDHGQKIASHTEGVHVQ